jgi:hypothetical protein
MTRNLASRVQAPAQTGPFESSKGDSVADIRRAKRSSYRAHETAEFRIIFVISFIAFLLESIASRAMPWRDHQDVAAAGPKKSIFAEARAATDRTIPFAFMN